ncbi:small ubiquitin-related modifier 2-like [Saccopteryx bilineata]|uniref:small ubiquitin-related modifier 2-like n=1 Tax=Saccopteryx bilineata TaxID=59482 RepID=UPI0033904F94
MMDEKPREGVKTENKDHINLKGLEQDGFVVQFTVKRHSPHSSKLMRAYCEQQVEDEDKIDEFQRQIGVHLLKRELAT